VHQLLRQEPYVRAWSQAYRDDRIDRHRRVACVIGLNISPLALELFRGQRE
jgi:hypothetical protein